MYCNNTYEEIITLFDSDIENGLSSSVSQDRLKKDGKNELLKEEKESVINMFFSQFKDFLIIVLLIASTISFFIGEGSDGFIILGIVFLNALIATIQEYKAREEIDHLSKVSVGQAKVLRDGNLNKIPSTMLVKGDIVFVSAGDFILADGRLISSADLHIDESSLTGESSEVTKDENVILDINTPLADMKNMVFSSCTVTKGRGVYIVTNTGMDTEIGKVADMISNAEENITPLEEKTKEIGKVLSIGCLLICFLIFIIGFMHGNKLLTMFMTSISLAVAAIPEGLPSIITIVLSLGVSKLSKEKVIVRKMQAIETIGNASVICSDKTGTLTKNKMSVEKVYTYDEEIDKDNFNENNNTSLKMINSIFYDCNDATRVKDKKNRVMTVGDSTDVALYDFAISNGINREKRSRVFDIPFDSTRKLMSTVFKDRDKYIIYTKGASDVLIPKCTHYIKNGQVVKMNDDVYETLFRKVERFSLNSYRVIAFSYKVLEEIPLKNEVENNLIFVGLCGIIDPPREEVFEAIRECKNAHIKPVMITGDHKLTASVIARDLGILSQGEECIDSLELSSMSDEELEKRVYDISVYSRVTPADKVRIVKAFQKNGEVVAMTGDGVNDAPSLKNADIGCAMGLTGTDVAKSAADMILTDDNFATIITAVKEGRGIFENIKKGIHFLISCNIGEIMTLLFATIFNYAMPLLPIHILWVNLVTDSLPALALGVDKNSSNLMNEEPKRRDERIFTFKFLIKVLFEGSLIGLVTLVGFWYGSTYFSVESGRTFAFLILCLSQLFHSFNVRAREESIFDNTPMRNKMLILANVVSFLLAVLVVIIEPLRNLFSFAPLDLSRWDFVLTLSLVPLITSEIVKLAKGIFLGSITQKADSKNI